jgi:L-fuconolactonase
VLAGRFPETPVILDHLARAGQGAPNTFDGVLRLAKHPRIYMKYSGVGYSSKQKYPYTDVRPMVRKMYDAFGPDRLLWGGLGHTLEEFEAAAKLLDEMFAFAPEAERRKIRGENAMKLFRFA